MSTLSEQLSDAVQNARHVPREMAEKLLTDVAGLCVAARRTDYVRASLAGWEATGGCTPIGHSPPPAAAGGPPPHLTPRRRAGRAHKTSRRARRGAAARGSVRLA